MLIVWIFFCILCLQERQYFIYYESVNVVDWHRGFFAVPALMRRSVSTRLAMPRPVVPVAPRIPSQNLHDSVSWLFNVSLPQITSTSFSLCQRAFLPSFSDTTTIALFLRCRTNASRSAYSYTYPPNPYLRPLLPLHRARTNIDVASERRERVRATEHLLCP